jgi:hypothetical protein
MSVYIFVGLIVLVAVVASVYVIRRTRRASQDWIDVPDIDVPDMPPAIPYRSPVVVGFDGSRSSDEVTSVEW